MNAFWKTISYGGFLALWLQGSQCLPSSRHSQEDKEQRKMERSISPNSSPRAMNVDGEEPYEESGESELDSESSLVISEVPNFSDVSNQQESDEASSMFTSRKPNPPSLELNAQEDLEPIGNSRIIATNSETKKLLPEEPSEIILFPKNHNPLRDFFQKKIQSFFPSNAEDEEEKAYMTKIFSKTLESISVKERDDAVVFLMQKNIPPKTIEKLFHIHSRMIEAFKICHPLDPEESYENRREKAIELLKKNIPITKISYIMHISYKDIKNIAHKEGIFVKENKKDIDYSLIPQDLLLEMDHNIPLEEKQKRAISLLEYNVFITKIHDIVHISNKDIKKLAEKNGITIRESELTFQAPDKIKKYMAEVPGDTTRAEKEKRALFLLENKVPIRGISQIVHMSTFNIKKLAEKHGITIRQNFKAFQVPDEIKEYMTEMPQDATREEKEKRALILLENKVPITKITSIIHMTTFYIKKLAEKHGIITRKSTYTFQAPDEIKEYMMEMSQDATMKEKEKRALILLDNKVPLTRIVKIVHVGFSKIQQLAEKHGIVIRKKTQTFQAPDEIKEYMMEMSQDATMKEKEKRALFLLENKVPVERIQKIVHMSTFKIKKLAEKHGITIRQSTHNFQVPDEIKEYMVEILKDTTREKKEKRALILLENKIPIGQISSIVHMHSFNIKKLAEKHGITIRKQTQTFQASDEIREYMVKMPKNTPKEEKEKRVLILLEHQVPIGEISSISRFAHHTVKKLAEKYQIATRECRKY